MTPVLLRAVRFAGMPLAALAQSLTEWVSQAALLTSGRILLGTHCACDIVTFSATFASSGGGGVSTQKVRTRFAERPAIVVVGQCIDAAGGPLPFPTLSWSWGAGTVDCTLTQAALVSPATITLLVVLG